MPGDTLAAAYRKMKMHDMSQLPVMVKEELVGIITEMDLLLAVAGNPDGFTIKAAQAMTKELITVNVNAQPTDLLEFFNQGMVAIVMDGKEFIGLVTPIDLLNYLRKRIGHA